MTSATVASDAMQALYRERVHPALALVAAEGHPAVSLRPFGQRPGPPASALSINDAMDEALVDHHHAKTALDIGYLGLSVKIGALDSEGGPALDAERIAACLADRKPGEYYIVDGNGRILPETALRMLRMLPDGLDFVLEAPCSTWRGRRPSDSGGRSAVSPTKAGCASTTLPTRSRPP